MSEESNEPPSVSTCYNFSIHPSDLQKLSEQLHLIEQRRARNLGAKWKLIIQEHCENIVILSRPVIAKRRIGHTSYRVTEFIMNADLDGLLPEHCELLLKFIPTKEEVRSAAHCTVFQRPRYTIID